MRAFNYSNHALNGTYVIDDNLGIVQIIWEALSKVEQNSSVRLN